MKRDASHSKPYVTFSLRVVNELPQSTRNLQQSWKNRCVVPILTVIRLGRLEKYATLIVSEWAFGQTKRMNEQWRKS